MRKLALTVLGIFVMAAFAQETPAFQPVDYNTFARDNGDGTVTSEIHQKWISYNTGTEWRKIDLSLQETSTGWVMSAAPYTFVAPRFADESAEFVATNKYDPKERQVRNDPPVSKLKRWSDAAHVEGELTDEGILYRNALPEGDILYQLHEQEWRSIVKMNQEPKGQGDVRIPFTEDYGGRKPTSKGKEIGTTDEDVGKGFGVSVNEFRGISTKTAYVWDSSFPQKRQEIEIRGRYTNGLFRGTKIIPREFLETATYPVYTDTTTTFFPDPNVESTSVDGEVGKNDSSDYTTTHDAATGTAVNDSSGVISVWNTICTTPVYYIYRGFLLFDTSSIPDTDTISSATFSAQGDAGGGTSNGDTDSIAVVASTPASNTALATADYDAVGTTQLSTGIGIGSISTAAYNDWVLNATGIANISTTGVSKFALRTTKDISATTPTNTVTCTYAHFESADNAGTSVDPKLVVTHEAAAPAVEEFVPILSIY